MSKSACATWPATTRNRRGQARGELIPNPFSLTPEQPEPLEAAARIVVIVIDELADLMMVVGKKIEELIARWRRRRGPRHPPDPRHPAAQRGRDHRPDQGHIPTACRSRCRARSTSRTILDQMGAEALLGQGDMLYLTPGGGGSRCACTAPSSATREVHRVVEYLKSQACPTTSRASSRAAWRRGRRRLERGEAPTLRPILSTTTRWRSCCKKPGVDLARATPPAHRQQRQPGPDRLGSATR